MDRLTQLLSFLENEPNDPFLIYAVATEYRSLGDREKSLDYFEKVAKEHPEYVATYYHLAQMYIELGAQENAEITFKKGIEVSQKAKDMHSLSELQNAYNNFLFDDLI